MDNPLHRPDNNFADLLKSVQTKLHFNIPLESIHINIVDLGLSPEEAHFLIRAAELK